MSAEIPSGPHVLAAGSDVNGYTIESLLGRGGMGNVYLATQRSLDRKVALKVLHPNRLRNPTAIEKFLREARAAGQLNHPNLIAVHDVFADEERKLYCYSMEYVEGVNGSQLVQKQGVLKRSQALHVIYQIANGLAHAHRHGIVHRDVKPDNILINKTGVAKLLDLGLVRDRLMHSPEAGSRVLSIVGTPEYSAPEQHRNPKMAVPASDVFSLGATLFFLMVGRPPISGETVIDLIVRVATESINYPSAIPADCRQLLDLMMAKRPAERLYDGDAVVAALQAVAEGRAPQLHANGNNEGGTTDFNDVESDFEDAETRSDSTRSTVIPQQQEQSGRQSTRRPIRRRRR